MLFQAGLPAVLSQHGRVVLSGFVVTPHGEESAVVRWIGCAEVNAPPYRRTFLRMYAHVLRTAGFEVTVAALDDEQFLICQDGPPVD
jgi:hypothetical protein